MISNFALIILDFDKSPLDKCPTTNTFIVIIHFCNQAAEGFEVADAVEPDLEGALDQRPGDRVHSAGDQGDHHTLLPAEHFIIAQQSYVVQVPVFVKVKLVFMQSQQFPEGGTLVLYMVDGGPEVPVELLLQLDL